MRTGKAEGMEPRKTEKRGVCGGHLHTQPKKLSTLLVLVVLLEFGLLATILALIAVIGAWFSVIMNRKKTPTPPKTKPK